MKRVKHRTGNKLLQGDPLSEIRIDSSFQILTQTDLQKSIPCAVTLARLRTHHGHCGELKVQGHLKDNTVTIEAPGSWTFSDIAVEKEISR